MQKEENKLRRIEGVMQKKIKTVKKETSMKEVIQVMAKNNISCVVVSESRKPVGIITERDIIKKVVLKKKDIEDISAKDIMSKKLYTVKPSFDLIPTGRMMKTKGVRRFPVVNEKGNLVGIVTQTDILEGIITLVKYLDWKLVKMNISVTEYIQKLKDSKFL